MDEMGEFGPDVDLVEAEVLAWPCRPRPRRQGVRHLARTEREELARELCGCVPTPGLAPPGP